MVTFVSLCLITYVILLPVTLRPACRPAVYSVLVTLPPTLLLVCSFLLSIHCMIWSPRSAPTSSSSNTLPCHISLLLPLSNFRTTPSLLSSNHFVLSLSSIPSWLSITRAMFVREFLKRRRRTCDRGTCLRRAVIWIQNSVFIRHLVMYWSFAG